MTELYDSVNQRRVPLSSHKQRTLMGALIVKCGSTVSAEQLSEEVWGNSKPRKSANALQAQIYRLRRMMDPLKGGEAAAQECLITEESGYVLRADPEQIDSEVFVRTVDRARHTAAQDPALAEKMVRGALKLWRGPALQGSRGPLCTAGAAMLEEARLSALELLYDVSLRANMHAHVIAELEELTNSYPLRERFYDQLMVALYRCGHQAQALSVYERVRRRLADELGVTPVPALSKRMQQILSHSPELLDVQASGATDSRGPQRITLRTQPSSSAIAPAPSTAPRPAGGVRRPPGPGNSGPGPARPGPLSGHARAESPVDAELRRLRLQVRELMSQQQTLVSTVQQLSTQLEEAIEAVEEHRPGHGADTGRPPFGEPRLLHRRP
ncbi:AfsR/SARP family transcriptional regulator [Streptomyces sp. Tu 3180]|uniref:AfsR/SARP family transcriptional regulator n=1 Tax=Streptomyces sp. Tu 3180 TaxID=2682611 RepID=UPI00135C974D|nr:AfsR/SARP family transcriptional regulator [Streptomyces sp. Tu 3180]KAF3468934.1 AfsR/SARP family transcriptional regulator [Streptomyces sp. Tu 3180]